LAAATQIGFLQLPAGWVGAIHPSPMRMWIFVLQGEIHCEARNDYLQRIAPGSAVLLEATLGFRFKK
jgi:hypothetical protein